MSDTIKGASCVKGAAFGTSTKDVRSIDDTEEVVTDAIERIDELEDQQLIDPTSNLLERAVVIYSGAKDKWFVPENQ